MSPSDAQTAIAALERAAGAAALSPDDLRQVVSVVTQLYASASARAGAELPPLTPDVSTTDAITLACALVRSQGLTPFEMAVWWNRSPG